MISPIDNNSRRIPYSLRQHIRRLREPIKNLISVACDILFLPLTVAAVTWLLLCRRISVSRLPLTRGTFQTLGLFPIRDHFYEPLFRLKQLSKPLDSGRRLPGISWNEEEQLKLLDKLCYSDEFLRFPKSQTAKRGFYTSNSSFGGFVAFYYYSIIRHFKPRKIVEVGSGMSTLLALAAIEMNKEADATYECTLTCIEPFLQPWLESTGARVVRQRLESLDMCFLSELEENDIFFIDSSHIIRPQGDVVNIYLERLAGLRPGVLVHAHDIFSPRDYPHAWLADDMILWNEQYLLEAFLSHNPDYRILGALTYLQLFHFDKLKATCPSHLEIDSQVSSFWFVRNGGCLA